MTRLYTNAERIRYHLNHKAYLDQIKGRDKPLRAFIPCEKALCFKMDIFAAGGDEAKIHYVSALRQAQMTPCKCHPGFSDRDIERLAWIPWENERKFEEDNPGN